MLGRPTKDDWNRRRGLLTEASSVRGREEMLSDQETSPVVERSGDEGRERERGV